MSLVHTIPYIGAQLPSTTSAQAIYTSAPGVDSSLLRPPREAVGRASHHAAHSFASAPRCLPHRACVDTRPRFRIDSPGLEDKNRARFHGCACCAALRDGPGPFVLGRRPNPVALEVFAEGTRPGLGRPRAQVARYRSNLARMQRASGCRHHGLDRGNSDVCRKESDPLVANGDSVGENCPRTAGRFTVDFPTADCLPLAHLLRTRMDPESGINSSCV